MAFRPRRSLTLGELQAKLQSDPKSLTLDEAKQLRELEKFRGSKPATDPDSRWWISRQEAADLLQQSVMNVDKLLQERKITRGERGIDIRSLIAHLRDKKGATGTNQDRWTKSRADMAELQLQQQQGALIKRDVVENKVRMAGQFLRNLIADAQTRLPEILAGQDVREISATLEKELTGILTSFNEQLSQVKESDART